MSSITKTSEIIVNNATEVIVNIPKGNDTKEIIETVGALSVAVMGLLTAYHCTCRRSGSRHRRSENEQTTRAGSHDNLTPLYSPDIEEGNGGVPEGWGSVASYSAASSDALLHAIENIIPQQNRDQPNPQSLENTIKLCLEQEASEGKNLDKVVQEGWGCWLGLAVSFESNLAAIADIIKKLNEDRPGDQNESGWHPELKDLPSSSNAEIKNNMELPIWEDASQAAVHDSLGHYSFFDPFWKSFPNKNLDSYAPWTLDWASFELD